MLLGVNIKSVLCKNIFEISTEVAINRSEEYQLVFAHVVSYNLFMNKICNLMFMK